jgi:alkylation response protein AidB-like acyl-CoA dehydrogenase
METADSPPLRELVGRAREITETIVAVNVEREDAEAVWPAPAMRALADAGLMGLNVPKAQGGHGQGLAGLLAVSETLAEESPSTALCFAMHCVGTAVIAAKATEHQKEAYLEPIARGEHVTTLALSEPGTGSQLYVAEARLTRSGGGYRVDGVKSFVTNGGHADSYVVSTRGVQHGEEGSFSCVLIDAGSEGMEWQPEWRGLGMRSNSSRTVELKGVEVPAGNLLGEEGDQLWYVFEVIAPYFLMAMAGTYAGVARASFDVARRHLGERRHSHSGEPDALLDVLACKAAAADAAVEIANEAMTLTGGSGYRENGKLARMLRDARAGHVMAPTTDMLKTWVGRALLNLPLL